MTVPGGLVRLQIPSLFDMVDLVQVLCDRMSHMAAFDDDSAHWIGVACRESVINAIKHGNRNDSSKRVFVEFETASHEQPELSIRVRDQGDGFDPELVERAVALIDRAEYKRRQAPPGVRLRPKAFGRDRRTPITNRWSG